MLPSAPWRTSAALSAMFTGRTRRAAGVPGVRLLISGLHPHGAGLVPRAERGALARQPFEQRRRSPTLAVLLVETGHALVDVRQADRVGVEHRPAAKAWKPVSRQVDHVDVGGPQRVAFLEDLRSLVDERVDLALDDLLAGKAPPPDARGGGGTLDQRLHLGIGRGRAVGVVDVPPGAGLLSEVVHRHELVGDERLAP